MFSKAHILFLRAVNGPFLLNSTRMAKNMKHHKNALRYITRCSAALGVDVSSHKCLTTNRDYSPDTIEDTEVATITGAAPCLPSHSFIYNNNHEFRLQWKYNLYGLGA